MIRAPGATPSSRSRETIAPTIAVPCECGGPSRQRVELLGDRALQFGVLLVGLRIDHRDGDALPEAADGLVELELAQHVLRRIALAVDGGCVSLNV